MSFRRSPNVDDLSHQMEYIMAKHPLEEPVHSPVTKRQRNINSVLRELLDKILRRDRGYEPRLCMSRDVLELRGEIEGSDDPSVCDNFAIVCASVTGREDIVEQLLLDSRVDPSAQHNRAIRLASERGFTGVVEKLLRDDRVDPHAGDALMSSCTKGHVEIVRMLLQDSRVVPDAFELSCAASRGHAKIVELFLEDGRVDPSCVDNLAIREACKNGRTEVVSLLLKHVDPSYDNNTLILSVCSSYYEYADIAKVLLADERVDPSVQYNEALRYACLRGHAKILRVLLTDSRVKVLHTHLVHACARPSFGESNTRGNYPNVVRVLLKHVDPSLFDDEALVTASRSGRTGVVSVLLRDDRVDPTARRNAPIRVASEEGRLGVVNTLIRDGRADVTVDNNFPIRAACMNGCTSVVKSLLADRRVDPSVLDNIAIREAYDRRHNSIVKLLLQDERVISAGGMYTVFTGGVKFILHHIIKYHGYKVVYTVREVRFAEALSVPGIHTGVCCLNNIVHENLIREVVCYV